MYDDFMSKIASAGASPPGWVSLATYQPAGIIGQSVCLVNNIEKIKEKITY